MPVGGAIASHAPPTAVAAVACHVRVPPPVFVSVMIFGGTRPTWPMMPPNGIVTGAAVTIGVVGCPILSVTCKVWVPPDQLKIIEPL